MKNPSLRVLFVASSLAFAGSLFAQAPVSPTPAPRERLSPHETVSTVIGDRRTGGRVTIVYGRPHSKSPKTGEMRKIWGELVPWGKPDRLGADEATLLLTEKPLLFGDTKLPAGAYTLYIVALENEPSKLVFSSRLGKWGIPVDDQHDVARVALAKAEIAASVDQLTISVAKEPSDANAGAIVIQWEKTQFSAPFKLAN